MKMVGFYIYLSVIISVLRLVHPARILILTVYAGNTTNSHILVLGELGKHLAGRGHHVTFPLSECATTHVERDLDVIRFPSAFSQSEWSENYESIISKLVKGPLSLFDWLRLLQYQLMECKAILRNDELYQKLNNSRFDIVIVDRMVPCAFLMVRRLGLPFIVFENPNHLSFLVDAPDSFPLSYVPVFTSGYSDRMSFLQRLGNVVSASAVTLGSMVMAYTHEQIDERFRSKDGRSLTDFIQKAELWLQNVDVALDFPLPVPPNFIPLGSLMVKPASPLPPELELIVSAADSGVILVSFGSYMGSCLGQEIRDGLLKALATLPQVTIWSSQVPLPNLPPNIFTYNWIPQNDLLGHPKMTAAVLHGGRNSVSQAIYHGVPTLIVPSGFDQDVGARVKAKNIGVVLTFDQVTPAAVRAALVDIIYNTSYKRNVMRLSAVMRDRPDTPLDRASYWIEYILRHGGQTLRPAGSDMGFIQLYLLDVKLTLFVISVVLLYCALLLIRFCWSCRRNLKSKTE